MFLGGSLIAAFVAGTIALLAPCCVSVLLPAYLAGSFQNRRVLIAMTFLFAAGIATIVLPIAVGAQIVQRVLTRDHAVIYAIGGGLLLGLGIYSLLGGQIHLPMPGRRAGGGKGPLAIYSLGLFSGVASSCCAPVLAGVIALSGLASSFLTAVGVGTAYVFGMVAPLFVVALLWERRDWSASRLFRRRSFTWRIGPVRRTISGTSLATGVLLSLMGVVAIWIAFARSSMPSPSGLLVQIYARIQHYGRNVVSFLAWVPGWLAFLVLAGAVVLLVRRARSSRSDSPMEETAQQEEIVREQPHPSHAGAPAPSHRRQSQGRLRL